MSDMTPAELRRLLRHVLDFEPRPNDVELAALASSASRQAEVKALRWLDRPLLRVVR